MSISRTQVDRRAPVICRSRIPSTVLLLTVLCSGKLLADRVELKTGEVFFGEILRADQREISVRLRNGGFLSFRLNQVARFRKNYVPPEEWIGIAEPVPEIDGGPGPFPDQADTPFRMSVTLSGDDESSERGISLESSPVDESLVRPPVHHLVHGFRVAPPRSFLDWEPPEASSTLLRFYDPVMQAGLDIVSLGSSGGSLEAVKNRTTASQSRIISNLQVVRDQQVPHVPYQGWLFEFTGEVNSVRIHQIQLFAMAERNVLLLTYSSPERHFDDFHRSFAESIRSFAFTEAEPVKEETPKKHPEQHPESTDAAQELLRLLRSGEEASGKTVDEFLKNARSRRTPK